MDTVATATKSNHNGIVAVHNGWVNNKVYIDNEVDKVEEIQTYLK